MCKRLIKIVNNLRRDSAAVTLIEALIMVVLISTVGVVALSTLVEFTYSSLRSENYQQRSNSLESVFGFGAARLTAANSDDLGVVNESSAMSTIDADADTGGYQTRSKSATTSTEPALGSRSRIDVPDTYRQAVQKDSPVVYYPFDESGCQIVNGVCADNTVVANAAPNPPPIGGLGIASLDGKLARYSGSDSGAGTLLGTDSLLSRHFLSIDSTSVSIAGNRALEFRPRSNEFTPSGYLSSSGGGYPGNFNLNANSFALEVWAESENSGTIIARRSDQEFSYRLLFEQSRLTLYGTYRLSSTSTTTAIIRSKQPVPPGHHHLVVTGSSSGIKFFVDGREVATEQVGAQEMKFEDIGNSGTLQISGEGSYLPSATLNRAVDEVAIYRQPLSAERVEAHYRAAYRQTRPANSGGGGGGGAGSNVNPASMAGDQLVFIGQGVCYRVVYEQADKQLLLASYEANSGDGRCQRIAPVRGPNESSGPDGDPVLDLTGTPNFNYRVLASGVEQIDSSTPVLSYYDQRGQPIDFDQQASSNSNNDIYDRLEYGAIGAIDVQAKVSGVSEDENVRQAEVPGSEFRQRYQLGLLCPIE